jgi:hypothetical protein
MPLRPLRPQLHKLVTRSTRTRAPAATASPAAWQQLEPLLPSGVCPCCSYILSVSPCNSLESDACPSGHCVPSSGSTASISATLGCTPPRQNTSSSSDLATRPTRMNAPAATASRAAGRQLEPLRDPDACPCCCYMISFTTRNPLDSDACTSGHCVPSSGATVSISNLKALGCLPLQPRHPQRHNSQPARLGRMPQRPLSPQQRGDPPAATTSSASHLAPARLGLMPQRPLRPQQRADSLKLCDARMHAPAVTTSPASHLVTCLTRMHAPAATTSSASHLDTCSTRTHAPEASASPRGGNSSTGWPFTSVEATGGVRPGGICPPL